MKKKKPWILGLVLLLVVLMSILYFTRDSYVSRTTDVFDGLRLESGSSLGKTSSSTSFATSITTPAKTSNTSQKLSESNVSETISLSTKSQVGVKPETTTKLVRATQTKPSPTKFERRPKTTAGKVTETQKTSLTTTARVASAPETEKRPTPSPTPRSPKPSPTASPTPTPAPTPTPRPIPPPTTSKSIDWSPYVGNSGMYWEIAKYGKDQAEQMAVDYVNEQLPLMFDPKSPWYGYDGARRYTSAEWLDNYGIWTVEFYKLDN